MPVQPVHSMYLDTAGGDIELDVLPPENAAQDGSSFVALSATGPLDARCPQTKPVQLLSCVGHLHLGGCMSAPDTCASCPYPCLQNMVHKAC